MATVCEVCYVSWAGDYMDIFHEDHAGKNIAYKLSKHLQCVTLEGIENPLICVTCWTTLESFHTLYNLVEDLHRPRTESCSSSDDDGDGFKSEATNTEGRTLSLVITDSTNDEVNDCNNDHDSEPVHEEVEIDTSVIVIKEENHMKIIDLVGDEVCSQDKLSDNDNADEEYDDLDASNETKDIGGHVEKSYSNSVLAQHPIDDTRNTRHRKKQFECNDCNRRYPSQKNLSNHVKVHHGAKDIVCNKCNKSFSKHLIKAHMRSIHGEPVHVCASCGKAYRTIAMLNKHEMQHRPVSTVACPVCKQHVRANYIEHHMKLMHTESQPVECESCRKSFLNNRTLLAHLKRSCPANSYRCETCKKSFRTIAKLTEHQNTHMDSARIYYMCPVCMEKFDCKSLLHQHQEQMHKNKK